MVTNIIKNWIDTHFISFFCMCVGDLNQRKLFEKYIWKCVLSVSVKVITVVVVIMMVIARKIDQSSAFYNQCCLEHGDGWTCTLFMYIKSKNTSSIGWIPPLWIPKTAGLCFCSHWWELKQKPWHSHTMPLSIYIHKFMTV